MNDNWHTNENWLSSMKNFFTKEEKIELLREYKKTLEEEANGVNQIIEQLEQNN